MNATDEFCELEGNFSSLPICCNGGSGTFLGGGAPFPGIEEASSGGLSLLYLLLLLYVFMGVGRAADVFMSAIEEITSQETDLISHDQNGSTRRFRAKVWNPTVANLTLMALGSSAPEILLSLIELLSANFYSGELGPSTIVGSAAFNLLVILAVCIVAIPAEDSRKIAAPKVYAITASASVFAYLWLVIILQMITPDIIDVPEAISTFLFFPLLVWLAFLADRGEDDEWRAKHPLATMVCLPCCPAPSSIARGSRSNTDGQVLLSLEQLDGTKARREDMARALKRLKRRMAGLFAKDDAAVLSYLQEKQTGQAPRSRAWYRVHASRRIDGSKSIDGSLASAKGRSGSAGGGSMGKGKLVEIETVALDIEGRETHAVGSTRPSLVNFLCSSYSVIENGGSVCVGVRRSGPADAPLAVGYKTVDGTATAGADYVAQEGTLQFLAGQERAFITVPILDDDEIENDETFTVCLTGIIEGLGVLGKQKTTTVTIVNDDFAGTITLPNEDVVVDENCGSAHVSVNRVNGCVGKVTCKYRTIDRTARAPQHYTHTEGTLEWGDKDVETKCIAVPIVDDDIVQGRQFFEVKLYDATGGAVFDKESDGASETSIARVTIEDDEQLRSLVDKAIAMIGMNREEARLGSASYAEQFADAFAVDDDAGCRGYCMHYISLPWKLLVACVPPTTVCGGKACFFAAIVLIGILTAFIGDLANLLGCTIGLKPSVVAITLVALGTSLPDTFASKSAALGDETADAAIGNVTGSNSVNVFLGLGLSWMVGAFYWAASGATAEWISRYPEIAARYKVEVGHSVGLAVPAGDLGFSVTVFVCCSLVCLSVLTLRRLQLGAELGLGYRWESAGLLVSLWLLYVTLSSLRAYGLM